MIENISTRIGYILFARFLANKLQTQDSISNITHSLLSIGFPQLIGFAAFDCFSFPLASSP